MVPATTLVATLPIVAHHTKNNQGNNSRLVSLKVKQIIQPGESIDIPVNIPNQTILAEGFRPTDWPLPQITEVKNNNINLTNDTNHTIILNDNKVNSIKLTSTQTSEWINLSSINTNLTKTELSDSETINLIKIGKTTPEIKEILEQAHRRHRKVFSKDLSGGYNGYYGPHVCRLNWISSQRPEARKIPIANYDFELKGVLPRSVRRSNRATGY